MGNARSRASRSIHAFTMQEDNSTALYAEPLLDSNTLDWIPKSPKRRQQTEHQRIRKKLEALDVETYRSLPQIDLPSLIHQLNSFFAVVWPVCITMVLASLAACYVKDAGMTQAMTTYMYYQDIDGSDTSIGQKSMIALCNALVVIAFIAFLTFMIVLLYKFNCIKLFFGYCIFYSASLLGMVGTKFITVLVGEKLHYIFDIYSLALIMYNFAIVGVISIFYQKGIATVIEHGYLIFISAMVAWQLSQLPEWSSWMILLLLGFWDLFAVLAPMGPLRCLVELIQEKGTSLPGLLFQADIKQAHQTVSSHCNPPENSTMTRGPMSERELMLHLLSDYRPRPTETDSTTILHSRSFPQQDPTSFQHQVCVFLSDQHSSFQHRAMDLSVMYLDRQLELWQSFYAFYHVNSVAIDKPYPQVHIVQSASCPSSNSSTNTQETEREEEEDDHTIKLGLGDFIFYSVLVARAAMHDFGAFIACFLCVIMGLAITMYLLARFDALPALPISIFTAIVAFVLSITTISPFLHQLTSYGIMAL